jgi:hypothetical protein
VFGNCDLPRRPLIGENAMRYPAWIRAVALATGLLATAAIAQVVDFGKYPDFSGQWDRTGPPNNWVTQSGPPPLTPEYQKVFEASKADQKSGRPGNWPSTFCIPEGMPAMMNVYDPLEIIIMPETTYILTSHNNDMYRRIYTDGRDWPVDPERTFAGYSIGKWVDENGEGKYSALEIETRFLRGPRAYENSGIPFHEDNETVIKERFYLDKTNHNTLYDDITVLDHALTRPYGKVEKLVRKQGPRPTWREETCEDNGWLKIGNDTYVVNQADGKLMPAYPNQPPPDFSFFAQPRK